MKVLLKVGILLAVTALGLIGLAFWLSDPLYIRAPKDDHLVATFRKHRSEFETLKQLATSKQIVFFSESEVVGALSDAEKESVRTLISKIGLGLTGSGSISGLRVVFAAGGISAVGPEWIKGIEYVDDDGEREGQVKNSLDHPASLAWGGAYIRKVEPHWFVFLEKDD